MAGEDGKIQKRNIFHSLSKWQRYKGDMKDKKAGRVGSRQMQIYDKSRKLGNGGKYKVCQKVGLFGYCAPLMKCYLLEQISQGI